MAEIVIFHHTLGLTEGVLDIARTISAAGHKVHTPDLFEGRRFNAIEDGVAFARETGVGAIMQRGIDFAEKLPSDLVYMGFSLGVMPAQSLAQTRSGARGAIFVDACLPVSEFSETWPTGLPVQVHGMSADPFFRDDSDLDAAKALVAETVAGELFLYDGSTHLFADRTVAGYDAEADAQFRERVLAFLDRDAS